MMQSIDINDINTITGSIYDRPGVQAAKPASPIRVLYEKLPNVYVFSTHKMFTTICAPFLNGISHFKILAMP